MRVRFENVGRLKATWEEDVESERAIVLAIERKHVLMSRDVWVEWDGVEGTIYAGMRTVGTISAALAAGEGKG